MDVVQDLPGVFKGRRHVYWSHCDPAGIVYEPRFGQWLHDLMERWFSQVVTAPYVDYIMKRRIGFPTKTTAATYHAPARLGDIVEVRLRIERIGTSSITFCFEGWKVEKNERGGDKTVICLFETTVVRVVTNLDTMEKIPVPDDLRAAIEQFMAATQAA